MRWNPAEWAVGWIGRMAEEGGGRILGVGQGPRSQTRDWHRGTARVEVTQPSPQSACTTPSSPSPPQGAQRGLARVPAGGGDPALPPARGPAREEMCQGAPAACTRVATHGTRGAVRCGCGGIFRTSSKRGPHSAVPLVSVWTGHLSLICEQSCTLVLRQHL